MVDCLYPTPGVSVQKRFRRNVVKTSVPALLPRGETSGENECGRRTWKCPRMLHSCCFVLCGPQPQGLEFAPRIASWIGWDTHL